MEKCWWNGVVYKTGEGLVGNLEEEVKKYNIVAIDTNSFIYLMENNPKYFEEVRNICYAHMTTK